ncbi:hypothetical protein GHT07_17905 [Caenimonas koreensis DSM 17982]|uniref:Uncharacterized protein n=1 Tax=Caenimonas koreensis DSM 17982 TaxID=1121255 RepID=A0A844AYN7_9BURK|nr:hypothetical protein [Caenimonas koreensis]MRD49154.1 hypothetical protein [Caenimonas koreensis DSM 17982]
MKNKKQTKVTKEKAGPVAPKKRVKVGEAIAALARGARLTDRDLEIMNRARTSEPVIPMRFD